MTIPDYVVDLSIPEDQVGDTYNVPSYYFRMWGPTLADAVRRAFQERKVLWVITVEVCSDATKPFARTLLERGATASTTDGRITVQIIDDEPVWSVGERTTTGINTSGGIGTAPVAVASDAKAYETEAAWFTAYNVTVEAEQADAVLTGYLSLATEWHPSVAAVADAMARTLNVASLQYQECTAEGGCPFPSMQLFFDLYDVNRDRKFVAEEIIDSGNISFFENAGLDMLARDEGRTVFWPSHDGNNDSTGSSWHFAAQEVGVAR